MAKTLLVTISQCGGSYQSWEHRARTTDRFEAIKRAVRRHFGRGAYWCPDSGLPGYGQIGVAADINTTRLITGRLRIDVE